MAFQRTQHTSSIFFLFLLIFSSFASADRFEERAEEIFSNYLPQETIHAISTLVSEKVYLVASERCQWIVKLIPQSQTNEQVLRTLWMTERASELNIGPKLLHIDLERRGSISEYVEGIPFLRNDEVNVQKILEKIKIVHTEMFPSVVCRIKDAYNELVSENLPLPTILSHAMHKLTEIDGKLKERTICHGDLHVFNIIVNPDQCYLIDWELSCFYHPYFDLVKMDPFGQNALLGKYLGKEPTQEEIESYDICERIFFLAVALNRLTMSAEDNLRPEERNVLVQQMDKWIANGGLDHPISYSRSPEDKTTLRMAACSAIARFLDGK